LWSPSHDREQSCNFSLFSCSFLAHSVIVTVVNVGKEKFFRKIQLLVANKKLTKNIN